MDGGPAFPIPHQDIDLNGQFVKIGSAGMSLRDYIAVKAMHAMLMDPSVTEQSLKKLGIASYHLADVMIAARTPPTDTQGGDA